MITGIIYTITHQATGKTYVGQTIETLAKRWRHHIKCAGRFDTHISRALAKYGEDAFEIEEIDREKGDRDSVIKALDKLEIYYIKTLDTANTGYNVAAGGAGIRGLFGPKNGMFGKPSPNRGKKASDTTRRKISLSNMGIAPWNKGSKGLTKASEETKQKMSIARKGKRGYWEGKKMSPEHRQKMSDAQIARWAANRAEASV